MPAAKPRRKIIRTRTNASENSLLSHNRTLVIRDRMVARRRGLLDDSAAGRLLDNSDIVIGIPSMFMCWRERTWCQPTIVRKLSRFATGFDRLPSTMPMAVNSVQLSGNQGAAFGVAPLCFRPRSTSSKQRPESASQNSFLIPTFTPCG
jgi:hypothetical protein